MPRRAADRPTHYWAQLVRKEGVVSCPTRLSSSWRWRPLIWKKIQLRKDPIEKRSDWEKIQLRKDPIENRSKWSQQSILNRRGWAVKMVKSRGSEQRIIIKCDSSRIYYLFRRNHRPYFLTHSPFFNNSLLWITGSDHLDCPYFYNSLFWSTWFAFLD